MNKREIKIIFADGKVDVVPHTVWDVYNIKDGMLVLRKDGATVAIYNMKYVVCIAIG